MTTPSLPQQENDQQQAERARALAWAQRQYTWAHAHTYDYQGQQLVLEPIAILAVDDQHPLPASQKPTLVQLVDLLTTGLDLLGNIIINLTNLLDVGAVRFDPPPPATEAKAKGLGARLRSALSEVVDEVEEVAKDLVGGVEDIVDDVAERVGTDGKRRIDSVEDLLAALAREYANGHAVVSRVHRGVGLHLPEERLVDDVLDSIADFFKKVLELLFTSVVEAILKQAGLYGPAAGFADFARQFQTIVVPNDVATGISDASFARMRVAGPNPLLLRRLDALPDNFPVDPQRFAAVTGLALADALADARVYLVDYAALGALAPSSFPAGPKYPSAPLALFALEGEARTLTPVAIQCSQTPGNASPVLYRDDGTSWALAKLHVQSADGNYHELISHLGLTHLLIEPFMVATHRNLAQQHPLFLLLLPHMQGTAFINNAAVTSLIAPGGTVDKLLAGTIESDWQVTATALQTLDFNAHMLPAELAARGVADPARLPDYPYRDDALLLWRAIAGWVRDYLDLYYNRDADVRADSELQAWYCDLIADEGGGIHGLGEPDPDGGEGRGLFTVAYLVEVVTMVIFTGSAQHASVNFPQLSIMSYTPAMPLATYAPPPSKVSGALPADSLLAHLPPLQMGLLQQLVGQLLGGVYFTRLGDYDRHQRTPWFGDPRVAEPLAAFQRTLVEVEQTIGAHNLRRPAYEVLLPSRIPQSINI